MELNIRKRESLLDGLVLYEPIDINLLDKCINSRLLKTNYQDKKWFKNEKQQLERASTDFGIGKKELSGDKSSWSKTTPRITTTF